MTENFNQNTEITTTNDYANYAYHFAYFSDITEFNRQGEEAYNEFKNNSNAPGVEAWRRQMESSRFLEPLSQSFVGTTKNEAVQGVFNTYIEPDTLKDATDAFDDILANIDMGGAFNKSKLYITENQMGIFDFGLASAGLYKVMEFYSEKLKTDNPFEFVDELPGIVPNIFVDKNTFGDFWYTNKEGKKYQMTQQPKGTLAMELNLPDATFEYKTTTEKSYLMFKREGGNARYVDLYVGCGGLGDMNASGMLARALPVLMAAQYFESKKIKTRINASRSFFDGFNTSSNKTGLINFCWTIKDFGETLDFTRIAIDTSDPRYFRFGNWKNVSAIMKKKYGLNTQGYGRTVYDAEAFLEIGNRYKNWYFEQMEKNLVPEIDIPRPLMMYGGLPNPPNTWNYSGQTDRTMQRIKQEFFRILDIVDFTYNNATKCCERIYKREVEEGDKSVRDFKRYVVDTISRAYSYPTRGPYADTIEQQEEANKQNDLRITQMANFLQSIEETA
jgi:hypothetical protein